MTAQDARAHLRLVTSPHESPWGMLNAAPLVRASIAAATESLERDELVIDSLEVMTCAAMWAATLFPEWAALKLQGKTAVLDDIARLLVATNLPEGEWPSGFLSSPVWRSQA